MTYDEIMTCMQSTANPVNVAGMARFGINPRHTLGISVATLRGMAKETGRDHHLALGLWKSDIHEARILACLTDVTALVDEAQAEEWVMAFDSWDICDVCCNELFGKTGFAYRKAVEWSGRDEEFVKRAGFVLMACLAVHDKAAADGVFLEFLSIVEREVGDERNFVKKAVNWALRQIGKRNGTLNRAAVESALRILTKDSKPARWIARDALRELKSPKILERLKD